MPYYPSVVENTRIIAVILGRDERPKRTARLRVQLPQGGPNPSILSIEKPPPRTSDTSPGNGCSHSSVAVLLREGLLRTSLQSDLFSKRVKSFFKGGRLPV